jgi:hypothetical protein
VNKVVISARIISTLSLSLANQTGPVNRQGYGKRNCSQKKLKIKFSKIGLYCEMEEGHAPQFLVSPV